MSLVLTRVAGQSIRVTDKDDERLTFDINIDDVRNHSVFTTMKIAGKSANLLCKFGVSHSVYGGTVTFHKGHRGRGQVRCVFDMPAHINIVRTELLK